MRFFVVLFCVAVIGASAKVLCKDDTISGGEQGSTIVSFDEGLYVQNCTFYNVSLWCSDCFMHVTDSTFDGGRMPIIGVITGDSDDIIVKRNKFVHMKNSCEFDLVNGVSNLWRRPSGLQVLSKAGDSVIYITYQDGLNFGEVTDNLLDISNVTHFIRAGPFWREKK